MKIKTITRSKVEQKKQTKYELPKLERNLDPALHPFAVEREYARALNAAKLEKLFAKPFVAAMSGHLDGIYCLRRHPTDIKTFLSGSFDGGVRVWNVANRQTKWSLTAHDACVRGVVVCSDNESFLTCSDDKTVKRWRLETSDDNDTSTRAKDSVLSSWSSQSAFTDIDVQRASSKFVTSGSTVELWDLNRSDSLSSYDWGVDSYIGVKFSPVEKDVFASLATDRGILLYDVRTNSILRKCVLPMRSNKIVWNPMEAFNFTVANEDHKLYTFDMRNLSKASVIHKGHVGAVLSLDYSPTGREFVSGSYDTTIRIFPHTSSRSRAVYHTQRMQRVFATQFTGDAQFVLSGSDDGNIRVWKSKASAPLRIVSKREKKSIQYRDTLRKKFRHMPEVARIERHQHLPKAIYKKREIEIVSTAATRKRESNKAKHSRPETKEEKQKKLSKVKSVVANIE